VPAIVDAHVTSSDDPRTRVAPGLIAAYRAAHYQVTGASPPFVLMIDAPSAALADCHRVHGVECSAFLTAWNPGSVPTPSAENAAAGARLAQLLRARGHRLLAGRSVDPAGNWEAEEGVLVLGMGSGEACAIGRAFGQAGLVHAERDAILRLVLLK
jgi:hypothetical protein